MTSVTWEQTLGRRLRHHLLAQPVDDLMRAAGRLGGVHAQVAAPISHRRHVIPEGQVDRVSRAAGWISPVLVVDGLIRGVWSSQKARDGVTLTIELFDDLPPKVRRAAEHHANRYEPLLDAPLTVRWA